VGDFADKSSERENSHKIDEKGWLGGRTTLPYQYSDEPDDHYMQMATNLGDMNAQPFVRGRRVHHTHMSDGSHDEGPENGIFDELKGIAGPNFVNVSCDSCHKRNGRATVEATGVPLDKWVFKVAAADGGKDPLIGSVLQPNGAPGEGQVSIGKWTENAEGLRSPEYAFTKQKPALFSARIAPPLIGLGLLEAVPETTIVGLADVDDKNGDGISGKPQISVDPVTGDKRLGRFGWKAAASSLKHQTAGALNTDMGVMTTVIPKPDCGIMQTGCGNDKGAELSDKTLDDLVKYVHLLGVRARRNLDDPEALRGEAAFGNSAAPPATSPSSRPASSIPSPSCGIRRFTRTPTCCCTTWVRASRTTLVKARPQGRNGGPPPYGESVFPPASPEGSRDPTKSECARLITTTCTTGGPEPLLKPSSGTVARRKSPRTPSSPCPWATRRLC
jgi:hypothetical protein